MTYFAPSIIESLIIAASTTTVLSLVWFLVSIIRKRNDVADIGWATYFIAIALVGYFNSTGTGLNDLRLIPLVLVLLWGIRLSFHIAKRHGHSSEDARYAAWRASWGEGWYFYTRSYFQIFFLQSLLALIIALPVVVIMTYGLGNIAWWAAIIGGLAWMKGYLFESIADRQLAEFLTHEKNRGHILNKGLWKYSRHPNYFGESLQWWGLWIMAIGLPYWQLAVFGPITITYLIRFVSGVPLSEKMMESMPEFAEYKKNTSVFIPWFPKK